MLFIVDIRLSARSSDGIISIYDCFERTVVTVPCMLRRYVMGLLIMV
jgi:hypothetical protein